MCYGEYGNHTTHMTNDPGFKVNSRDLPVTALAYQSAALLKILLGFLTFWGLMFFGLEGLRTFVSVNKEISTKEQTHYKTYQQELDLCQLQNPNSGKVIYDLRGNAIQSYPYVNCWAKARLVSSNR